MEGARKGERGPRLNQERERASWRGRATPRQKERAKRYRMSLGGGEREEARARERESERAREREEVSGLRRGEKGGREGGSNGERFGFQSSTIFSAASVDTLRAAALQRFSTGVHLHLHLSPVFPVTTYRQISAIMAVMTTPKNASAAFCGAHGSESVAVARSTELREASLDPLTAVCRFFLSRESRRILSSW